MIKEITIHSGKQQNLYEKLEVIRKKINELVIKINKLEEKNANTKTK